MEEARRGVLTGRMERVLQVVIEDYIQTGEPVGSRTASHKLQMNLSAATVRNIMADLEGLGLLSQPHTSAGRIPTEKGLRFYVDHILDVHELSEHEQQEIRSRYPVRRTEGSDLFRQTSRILSTASHYMGLVWAPRMNLVVLQHVEFVKLKGPFVLALFVSPNGLVQNRILEVQESYSQSDLDRFSEYMNSLLQGLTLQQVREKILDQMRQDKRDYDRLFEQALRLGQKAFSLVAESDVFIDGRTNIIEEPEFSDVLRMRNLFRAFEEKATMVKLLDKCLEPKGVQIVIGSENPIREIESCSLVTSTYSFKGEVLGALGVLGPRRMNYSKVIPLVDYTAKLLTEILESQ